MTRIDAFSLTRRPRAEEPLSVHLIQPGQLLRVSRCARYLNVSRKWIYYLILTKRLDHIRLSPRGIRIKSESLLEYISARSLRAE